MSMETSPHVGIPISSATSFMISTAFSPTSVFAVVAADVVVSSFTKKKYKKKINFSFVLYYIQVDSCHYVLFCALSSISTFGETISKPTSAVHSGLG